jgi:AcrR family transcriptional regulator
MAAPQSNITRRRLAARAEGSDEYQTKLRELVNVAADVFKEKGYEAATLAEIAERFGSVRASLYYYVSGKEELFQEAVRDILARNLADAERIHGLDLQVREKLDMLISQLIASYEDHYPHMSVYVQENMLRVTGERTVWATQMVRDTRRLEKVWISLLQQGMEERVLRSEIPAVLMANILFGMCNWTHRWFKPGPKLSASQIADAISKIFFEGAVSQVPPAPVT